jgi:hypothetical protein
MCDSIDENDVFKLNSTDAWGIGGVFGFASCIVTPQSAIFDFYDSNGNQLYSNFDLPRVQ